jgi:hypothetical protein
VIEHTATIVLNARPNAVWQFIQTVDDWQKWNRRIESAERLTAGNWEPGFRFRQKSERLAFVYTVTAVELGRSAAWTGTRAGLTRGMSVEIRALEGDTEVSLRQTADGARTAGPLGWFVRRGLRRSLRAWTDGLRNAVASLPVPGTE